VIYLIFCKGLANPALPREAPVEISRIMVPDDTNSAGNVHGGTILKLMEQAGFVVANRHCNQKSDSSSFPITTALVRLEKMDFLQPVHVGDVAQVQAAVTFTSKHSLEVTVDVWAENVVVGERRHTNTARLWYVALNMDTVASTSKAPGSRNLEGFITAIPPVESLSHKQLEAGKKRYETQKASRVSMNKYVAESVTPVHIFYHPKDVGERTVLASQTTLANTLLPSDCTITGHVTGGTLMKMMDSAGAICSARHCRNRTVTAGIDVINFCHTIVNGEMVYVTARIIFTSSKSMEVEVRNCWRCLF